MKCTNKILCYVLAATFVLASGCGENTAALSQPYDIYSTTDAVGMTASVQKSENAYFSNSLCVAEDVSIGTDVTDSQVAEGAGTFNLSTGEVVYAKNLYKKLYPASTTKVLTAYIALKYCQDLDVFVTVSEYAADQAADSSKCDLRAGDVVKMRDLLYGMMLRSGNDAAIAIAEYISGDVNSFAALMNQEAKALGATQSNFVNPNGLPDENHYTSVYDMYLLFAKAIEQESFLSLIGTKSYDVVYTNAAGKEVKKTWENTNYYMTGQARIPEGFTILGGKTGTTNDAGYCLVLYSTNPAGEPVISIVFKADGRYNLYLLMNEMLENFAV